MYRRLRWLGTGKSFTVSAIVQALHLNPVSDVCYAAYTGKAASVLKEKGNPNAITIHKLIYKAYQQKDGTYQYKLKDYLEHHYKLIIVDEVSMCSKQLWEDLLSFGVHIIALGDPGQLSPPSGETCGVLENPNAFLSKIMRQAEESEIIRLSMHIREGKSLDSYIGTNEEVKIVNKRDLIDGMLLWADQILCATNAKRISLNDRVRKLLGKGDYPEIGDKIISLKNHWDYFSENFNPLINGEIGEVTKLYPFRMYLPYRISNEPINILFTSMTVDNDNYSEIPIDEKTLLTGQKSLNPKQEMQMARSKKLECPPPFEFAYAYALTVDIYAV